MHRIRAVVTSFWFKITLSGVLLAVLFSQLDLAQLLHRIADTHYRWLLAAIAGYLLSQVMSAARWYLLARPLGFHEPFVRFCQYYFSGMFLNLFVPSTVAGDVNRALLLAGGKKRRTLAATTVLADRGIGLIALVWIGAAAILLLRSVQLPMVLYWLAAVAPVACAAVWWWPHVLAVRLLPPGSRWRVLVERDLRPYRRDHRLLAAAFVLAALFHAVQIVTQILIAWALGLRIPWLFFFAFVPIVNIAGMLPITLNGVGVREAGYWYFLNMIGIGREAAVAFGLLSSAVAIVSGMAGAPMFLRSAAARPPGARRT